MQVFIKTSSIPEVLGDNFSVYGSLTPQDLNILSRSDIINGYILQVLDEEVKVIISPLDTFVQNIEVDIDTENETPFKAESFSNTGFRPVNENDEISFFREEIFPEEKIEEIQLADEGYPIHLDFLDRSIDFVFTDSERVLQPDGTLLFAKIAKNTIEGEEDPLVFPFFVWMQNFDESFNLISSVLDIYDPQKNLHYKVSRNESDTNFVVKEYVFDSIVDVIEE